MQEQIEKIKQELNRRKLKQSSLAAEYRKLTNEQIVDGEGTDIEKAFKRQAGAREALEWVLSILQPKEDIAPPLQQAAVMRPQSGETPPPQSAADWMYEAEDRSIQQMIDSTKRLGGGGAQRLRHIAKWWRLCTSASNSVTAWLFT